MAVDTPFHPSHGVVGAVQVPEGVSEEDLVRRLEGPTPLIICFCCLNGLFIWLPMIPSLFSLPNNLISPLPASPPSVSVPLLSECRLSHRYRLCD